MTQADRTSRPQDRAHDAGPDVARAAPGAQVLFVDDEPDVLDALRRSLEMRRVPWSMRFVGDPRLALELCRASAFDLVVADIRMPGMDGVTLIEAMRAASPGLRSIVLSGVCDFDIAVDAVNRAGIVRFLRKPCPVDELIQAVDAALTRRASDVSAQAALDQLPMAVLVVDRDARLLFANRHAAEGLQRGDALRVDVQGQLVPAVSTQSAALLQAVRAVAAGNRDDVLALPSLGGSTLSLGLTGWGDGAAIYVHDAAAGWVPAPAHLSKLLGLTPSEARLAHALTVTGTLEEAARMCGLTPATARTYLKVVFGKTGTRRQADLVRLVMGQPRLRASAPQAAA